MNKILSEIDLLAGHNIVTKPEDKLKTVAESTDLTPLEIMGLIK